MSERNQLACTVVQLVCCMGYCISRGSIYLYWFDFLHVFLKIRIYSAVMGLSCGTQGICSIVWRLSSWRMGSLIVVGWVVVMAHGLSCSTACGTWVHDGPEIEPVFSALQSRFLITSPPEKSLIFSIFLLWSCWLKSWVTWIFTMTTSQQMTKVAVSISINTSW